jgi:hypothetical protein
MIHTIDSKPPASSGSRILAGAALIAGALCATTFAQEPAKDAAKEPAKDAPAPETPAFRETAPTAAPAEAKPAEAKPAEPEQAAPPAAEPAKESGTRELMGNEVAPGTNFAMKLMDVLVKNKVITKEQSEELIKEAQADSAATMTVAQTSGAIAFAELKSRGEIAPSPPADADAVRVTYIPEVVKKQIRDELRADIKQQAKDEKWASATKIPDWVTKFRVKGDLRLRGEGVYYPSGNDNTGAFPNFNSINSGAPFDVSGTVFSPQLNVDQDRSRFRLRFRIGAEVDMGDGLIAGMRIATGSDSSPVTTNQTLGGQFNKYQLWLDRAFIKYEAQGEKGYVSFSGGRIDNPFMASDVIFDEDLGFDGLAFSAKYKLGRFTPFVTAGAFPIFNTDFNFSSNQPAKFDSTDKYLYGGQIGTDVKVTDKLSLKLGVAYYDFDGARGEESTPFTPLTTSDAGDTDGTRPSFAQKGNTYIPLRRIIPNANNNFGTSNQFQYFGLATDFRPLAISGKLEYNGFEPFQVAITGEYIRNTAFDRDRLNLLGVNNRAARSVAGTPGAYSGGDTAWMMGIRAGTAAFDKRGDWQVGMNYKHIESDAVIDGFTDSDFGGGGTNMKGYSLWGTIAVTPKATLGLRWVSTSEITGPPLENDALFFDFNGKF